MAVKKIKAVDYFFSLIQVNKTHIKDMLPFIWVFGSSEHNSRRDMFQKWHLCNTHLISEENRICTPEEYPNWINFNNYYNNLVDFERDIVSISKGAIIFSESVGSYAEIGAFSCFPFLYKNLLIVADEEYLDENSESFFYNGPILKIKGGEEESQSIWAIENSSNFNKECLNISNYFQEIIKNQKVQILNKDSDRDITLLLIDLIELFPRRTKKDYEKILEKFSIEIKQFNFPKIFRLLQMLEIISSRKSGNNTLYELVNPEVYAPCIEYTGTISKPFERALFKIEISDI